MFLPAVAVGSAVLLKMGESMERHRHERRAQEKGTQWPTADIFVVIPCFRQPERTARTLDNLYGSAAVCGRIHVGVVAHCDVGDITVSEAYDDIATVSHVDKIKVLSYPAEAAAGAQEARNLACRYLYTNEQFILYCDCHCAFAPSWDEMLLEDFFGLDSARAVLTTLPPCLSNLEQVDMDQNGTFPFVPETFGADGILQGRPLLRTPSSPSPSAFFCGALAFAQAPLLRELPYDKAAREGQLDIIHTAYLWLQETDFFCPRRPVVAQAWEGPQRPTMLPMEQLRLHLHTILGEHKPAFYRSVGYDVDTDTLLSDGTELGLTVGAGAAESAAKCGAAFTLRKQGEDTTMTDSQFLSAVSTGSATHKYGAEVE